MSKVPPRIMTMACLHNGECDLSKDTHTIRGASGQMLELRTERSSAGMHTMRAVAIRVARLELAPSFEVLAVGQGSVWETTLVAPRARGVTGR